MALAADKNESNQRYGERLNVWGRKEEWEEERKNVESTAKSSESIKFLWNITLNMSYHRR